jgi:hypothetical protein
MCRSSEPSNLSMRDFFSRCATLASLLAGNMLSAASIEGGSRVYDLKPRPPHFPPKSKAVIQLFQNGGPSHVDLFDYKPALQNGRNAAQPRAACMIHATLLRVLGINFSDLVCERNGLKDRIRDQTPACIASEILD